MQSVEETINFASGDSTDFYQVEVIGGIDYTATALSASNAGGSLQDPYLVLFDVAGNPLERVDNHFALGSDCSEKNFIQENYNDL